MKVKPADADRFIANPNPDCVAVLIYGPDDGLVRARGKALISGRIGSDADPMLLADLTDTDLKSDPARLADEAGALSLIPGSRCIRIKATGEAAAGAVENLLQGCADGSLKSEALVVIEAGDLNPRSTLRKLCEGAPNAAAVACYADDRRSLEAVIRRTIESAGRRIDPDAMAFLGDRLGADRGLTERELEKLITYKGSDETPISLTDVQACLPPDAESGAEQIADQVAAGEIAAVQRALDQAKAMGNASIGLLRGVAAHFQRLHGWTGAIASGQRVDEVLSRARPPIHFKRQPSIKRHLSIWTPKDVETALTALLETERQCKTTGLPETMLTERVLLSLTRRAARAARR